MISQKVNLDAEKDEDIHDSDDNDEDSEIDE